MTSAFAKPPLPPGEEAAHLLQEYLRIDTTNPPGNELPAARWLAEVLASEGIESRLLPFGEGRANLVARLPGANREAVVLLHHMDVVPAEPAFWSVPPFSGSRVEGKILGRGAVDIKGKGIVDLVTVLTLKRRGIVPPRDVVFLAVADEEVGSLGSQRMATIHRNELGEVAAILDEGGCLLRGEDGQDQAYLVAVANKSPLWLRVTFQGPPGHGSQPIPDSAVAKAVRAAQRLLDHPPPIHLIPAAEAYLRFQVRNQDLSTLPGWQGDLESSLGEPSFLEALAGRPELNPLLRNTVSVTQLAGSPKINAFSNEASLGLDCRLLPGESKADFMAWLRATMEAPEARIEEVEGYLGGPPEPLDAPFLQVLRQVAARRTPGVPVIPTVLTSSTDSFYYRQVGIPTYGFEPYPITSAQWGLAHANDEALDADLLGPGVELLLDLIQSFH